MTATGTVKAGTADISGETYTGGWFRTRGNSGWYNEKWDGGWYERQRLGQVVDEQERLYRR